MIHHISKHQHYLSGLPFPYHIIWVAFILAAAAAAAMNEGKSRL